MPYVGERMRRREDPRLIRGEGRYAGDLEFPGMLHVGFVRSPYAHARVRSVDLSGALTLPGVVAAYAAADLPQLARPTEVRQAPSNLHAHGLRPLEGDTVRYVGEQVAVEVQEARSELTSAPGAPLRRTDAGLR